MSEGASCGSASVGEVCCRISLLTTKLTQVEGVMPKEPDPTPVPLHPDPKHPSPPKPTDEEPPIDLPVP